MQTVQMPCSIAEGSMLKLPRRERAALPSPRSRCIRHANSRHVRRAPLSAPAKEAEGSLPLPPLPMPAPLRRRRFAAVHAHCRDATPRQMPAASPMTAHFSSRRTTPPAQRRRASRCRRAAPLLEDYRH